MVTATELSNELIWAVFTKPWPMHTAKELSEVIVGMGFNAAEIPVRANTFITPDNAATLLPGFVAELQANGVRTISIAAELSEPLFAACQQAGVPLIRIMVEVTNHDYPSSIAAARQRLNAAVDWARHYDVGVAIQPHRGQYVSSCVGVLDLIQDLPPEYFKIVWDSAHDALAGDDPITTLNACGERLAIANFKNVIYTVDNSDASESGVTKWKPWYVPGPEGLGDWQRALGHLHRRASTVPLCFTAQYSTTVEPVEVLLERDLRFAQGIWNSSATKNFPIESQKTP